ncbi:MAG TPA: aminoacyl-tRNA hydrolase [Acholeplasma sp.]|jgi:PTH1 family peptidyl-tRNA hydrolase|nr:aminoacyl-tRNA hydrolase [Acholeplasmatales bacterium]HHV33846.1 aminoacyl-tRNA hydrolase [Acholeplasma sp.]
MKLIVGLGNPDSKYEKTRHNAGYMAVDLFAERENLTFKYDTKFLGEVAVYFKNNAQAIILKPYTYMNLSGRSVTKVSHYYKIPTENILIIYDDVDVDLGALKLRLTGSSGGHKGMEDVINHLMTRDVKRVRIGIGKDDKKMIDFVLSKFSRIERKKLEPVFDSTCEVMEEFIKGVDFELIMNKYNKKQ